MNETDRAFVNDCEHHFESRVRGGHPLYVRLCTLCRAIDWADLDRQAGELRAAASAVVAPPTDRAAVLREAADELGRMDYDTDSNDYGYDTYRDAWNGGVMDGAEHLRRLAVEAHDTGTQQQEAEAPDELATARATNQRLNYEKQRLESELATYRRAVRQWDVSERGTYIPHASLRTIGKASGVDILGSVRHLKHFERVEQAEAAIERVRQLHDRLAEETDLTSPDDSITRGAAAKRIATALDGWTPPAPVAQQPAPLRGELKPWQLLADTPDEPLPQTERVIGGRRLGTSEQQAAAADGEETRTCGAWGGCPLPAGHNKGRADIPENHHGLREDLFTGPQWETRDPEAEERERDIQREA